MVEKQNNKGIIILLVIIVIIISVLCVLFATGTISLKNIEINDNQNIHENNNETNTDNDNNISNDDITEEKLVNIIESQLFVLFDYYKFYNSYGYLMTSKDDLDKIDNQTKLFIALNILKENYTASSNDIEVDLANFSKDELENAFNSSVISNLGIEHEDFDIYYLLDDAYYKNTSSLYSKTMSLYNLPQASKVKNYEKDGDKYIISMNYLFPNDIVGITDYYGSLNDAKNKTNAIVTYEDYFNVQEYLNNNYDNIKDKLATYNYTFEVTNNKINLVDFSIN